ncbi:MAG: DUF3558 domain-containing protein [Pseudonocardiaceae bacterium]
MVAAGSVILLAGCNTGTGAPSEPVRSSSAQAASPIPPVNNPRDVTAVARRTCELLTPEQAEGFGLDLPPTPSDGLFGTVYCVWTSTARDRSTVRRVAIRVFTNNPTLEVAYDKDRARPSFELTETAGYPTLVSRSNADLPICNIDVKAAERQSVSITYESKEFDSNPQQSCEVGKQVAAAVLMNVPLKS